MQFCLPILHFKESHIIEKLQAKYALSIRLKRFFFFLSCQLQAAWQIRFSFCGKWSRLYNLPRRHTIKAETLEQPLQIPLGGYFEI